MKDKKYEQDPTQTKRGTINETDASTLTKENLPKEYDQEDGCFLLQLNGSGIGNNLGKR